MLIAEEHHATVEQRVAHRVHVVILETRKIDFADFGLTVPANGWISIALLRVSCLSWVGRRMLQTIVDQHHEQPARTARPEFQRLLDARGT
jgi:hypothetical protein